MLLLSFGNQAMRNRTIMSKLRYFEEHFVPETSVVNMHFYVRKIVEIKLDYLFSWDFEILSYKCALIMNIP